MTQRIHRQKQLIQLVESDPDYLHDLFIQHHNYITELGVYDDVLINAKIAFTTGQQMYLQAPDNQLRYIDLWAIDIRKQVVPPRLQAMISVSHEATSGQFGGFVMDISDFATICIAGFESAARSFENMVEKLNFVSFADNHRVH